jgi:hypothetical protein
VPLTSLWLRTAVIEDTITYTSPPGINGEQVFYQVLRKLLPDSVGINLPVLSNNQALTYTFSYNINTSVIVPAQLKVVSFIQSDSSKRVFQSGTSDPFTGIADHGFQKKEIRFFPNPSCAIFSLRAAHEIGAFSIIDIYGNVIRQGKIRANTWKLDLSDFASGVYVLRTESDNYKLWKN